MCLFFKCFYDWWLVLVGVVGVVGKLVGVDWFGWDYVFVYEMVEVVE